VLVVGGLVLASCGSSSPSNSKRAETTTTDSTAATSTTTGAASAGSSSGLSQVEKGLAKTSGTTFSVTYLISEPGNTQSVTFAQSPPKEAVITKAASFYVSGKSTTYCYGTGKLTCSALPASMRGLLAGFEDLFVPGVLTNDIQDLQSDLAAHAAGYSATTSSGTFGRYASTCVTVKESSKSALYCAADSNGVLTHLVEGDVNLTLTAFSANPPASTFLPPTGATMGTLPAGV
jgi:hypothetical protein